MLGRPHPYLEPSSRGSGKSPRGGEVGWSLSTQRSSPTGSSRLLGAAQLAAARLASLQGSFREVTPPAQAPSQSRGAARPCLNSSPRVLSSNFQPLPLGITGPTQLKEAFSLTPGIPRNTPQRHMTKLLPAPCCPSLLPQTTSHRCGGPTRRTLALQGLMAPALLFLRQKPTPLLFLQQHWAEWIGQMQRQRQVPPVSSPCPLRTLTFSHRARLCSLTPLNQGQEAGESRQV